MSRGGLIWGTVNMQKAKAPTNAMDAFLQQAAMHFTAGKGNIRRPSSYHRCSPGTHPSQPMRLPSSARSRCIYPSVLHCEPGTSRCKSAAQHSTAQHSSDMAQSSHGANCSLHPAMPQPSAASRRCPHSLSRSYRPLRSPIRSCHSRYLGGATPVRLAFTRQSDLQGTPGVPWALEYDRV